MSWLAEHLFGAKNSSGTINEGQGIIDKVTAEGDTEVTTEEQMASLAPSIQIESAIETSYEKREIAAEWRVPLRGKLHKIEFEHGTTSGRRVLWIDEEVTKTKNLLLANMQILHLFGAALSKLN